jgi:hypothetical protein
LKKDWLDHILSWQGKSGCFIHADKENRLALTVFSDYTYVDVEYPVNSSYSHLVGPQALVMYPWQRLRRPSSEAEAGVKREKRNERIVEVPGGEECLFHFTAMGLMVLALHLRQLLEQL